MEEFKIYPTEVKKIAANYIQILEEDGFFVGGDITDTSFAEKYIKEILLEKFINGETLELGSDEEINTHLDYIIVGSIFYDLKKSGYIGSYEDENTKEKFFLTEKGRDYFLLKKNKPLDI